MNHPGLIYKYSDYLPVDNRTPVISLNEGNTPLLPAPHIAKLCGEHLSLNVYLKLEGLNPTGSFKDRGMTMAVSKAIEEGSEKIICASTGNTSASAAAYAARARSLGHKCDAYVIVPAGYVALGKISQALIYGAEVIQIEGNFDAGLNIVKELSENYPIALVNSVNPYRIEGQKTAAFEVCEQLGRAPDVLCIPVGNAGNITAYWKGFMEASKNGDRPRMCGFQAEGASPIVQGRVFENPETIGTAIRIGNPASWKQAEAARDESHGFIDSVTDDQIIEAYKIIHASEGANCEPASAASVAGLIQSARAGKIAPESTIVCVLTGNGLKDPNTAISTVSLSEQTYKADTNHIAAALGLVKV